jgi:hypothetical protein
MIRLSKEDDKNLNPGDQIQIGIGLLPDLDYCGVDATIVDFIRDANMLISSAIIELPCGDRFRIFSEKNYSIRRV